jgi:hypothetical protein
MGSAIGDPVYGLGRHRFPARGSKNRGSGSTTRGAGFAGFIKLSFFTAGTGGTE